MSKYVTCPVCIGKGFIERCTREYCEHRAHICKWCLGTKKLLQSKLFDGPKEVMLSRKQEDLMIEMLRSRDEESDMPCGAIGRGARGKKESNT